MNKKNKDNITLHFIKVQRYWQRNMLLMKKQNKLFMNELFFLLGSENFSVGFKGFAVGLFKKIVYSVLFYSTKGRFININSSSSSCISFQNSHAQVQKEFCLSHMPTCPGGYVNAIFLFTLQNITIRRSSILRSILFIDFYLTPIRIKFSTRKNNI